MFKRILVLAPHTDDGELGCGGAVARFLEEGREVYQAVFSAAARSLPEGLPSDTLVREWATATSTLGIPAGNLVRYDFPVREFPARRQEILENLSILRRELDPDLVLLPSLEDLHQDHRTIAREGIRAFKQVSVLGYELPWNNLEFRNNCFIILQESHLQKKAAALACYRSQSHRKYCRKEFVLNLAGIRGAQIGADFAELFNLIRLVIK